MTTRHDEAKTAAEAKHHLVLSSRPNSSSFDKRAWPFEPPVWDEYTVERLEQACIAIAELSRALGVWTWLSATCETPTRIRVECKRTAERYQTEAPLVSSFDCDEDEDCVQFFDVLNYRIDRVTAAACVPRAWKRLATQVRRHGTWIAGLVCAVIDHLRPSSNRLSSSAVDFAVHVHRPSVTGSGTTEEVAANQVFFWDVSKPVSVLLQEDQHASKASVPFRLEHNVNRTFKCCVTIPDYWEWHQSEVVVEINHSHEYDKVEL